MGGGNLAGGVVNGNKIDKLSLSPSLKRNLLTFSRSSSAFATLIKTLTNVGVRNVSIETGSLGYRKYLMGADKVFDECDFLVKAKVEGVGVSYSLKHPIDKNASILFDHVDLFISIARNSMRYNVDKSMVISDMCIENLMNDDNKDSVEIMSSLSSKLPCDPTGASLSKVNVTVNCKYKSSSIISRSFACDDVVEDVVNWIAATVHHGMLDLTSEEYEYELVDEIEGNRVGKGDLGRTLWDWGMRNVWRGRVVRKDVEEVRGRDWEYP